jgi:hypothetical protein
MQEFFRAKWYFSGGIKDSMEAIRSPSVRVSDDAIRADVTKHNEIN